MAKEWQSKLVREGFRVELDDSDEKIGKKIRNAAMMKIPWTVVIGKKEAEGGDFVVNVFGQKENLTVAQKDFVEKLKAAAKFPTE